MSKFRMLDIASSIEQTLRNMFRMVINKSPVCGKWFLRVCGSIHRGRIRKKTASISCIVRAEVDRTVILSSRAIT